MHLQALADCPSCANLPKSTSKLINSFFKSCSLSAMVWCHSKHFFLSVVLFSLPLPRDLQALKKGYFFASLPKELPTLPNLKGLWK